MQKTSLAVVPLQGCRRACVTLCVLLACVPGFVHGETKPKTHTVSLGAVRRVPFVAADVAAEDKADSATTLKVRPILVDGRVREWATGDAHDITERTFVIRRVLHINDTLAGDKGQRWIWQPGPWLSVDRSSGHIAVLHMPDFDDAVSDVVWFRDYAAYCGVHSTTKTSTLIGAVWQIGSRRLALQKPLGKWPQQEHPRPVCMPAIWQREPMRVVLQVNGAQPATFDVTGTRAAMVDEGDSTDAEE